MADDTATVLRQLNIDQADFFGYSVRAGIALQLALRQPNLVRTLVLAALAYNRDGFHPGLLEGIDKLTPEAMAGSPFEQAYARTARRPDDWPALIRRVQPLDRDREFQGWPAEAIRAIRPPALLVFGDSDIVAPEHAVELFRLFDGGVAGDVAGLPAPGWRGCQVQRTSHSSTQPIGWCR
jgi:pimeloyl-ACP methyl ester carboxylesterase